MAAQQTQVLHQHHHQLHQPPYHQQQHQPQVQHLPQHMIPSASNTPVATPAMNSSSHTSPSNPNTPHNNGGGSSSSSDGSPKKSAKWDGDEMLHAYIVDYLRKRGFLRAVAAFAAESNTSPNSEARIDAPQGLLFEWWVVFWDLFKAKTDNGCGTNQALVYVQAQNRKVEAAQAQMAQRMSAWAPPQPQHHPQAQPHLVNMHMPQQLGHPIGHLKAAPSEINEIARGPAPAPQGQSPFTTQPRLVSHMPHLQNSVNQNGVPPNPNVPHQMQHQQRMASGNFSSPVMAAGQAPNSAPSPQFPPHLAGQHPSANQGQGQHPQSATQAFQPQSSRSSTPGQSQPPPLPPQGGSSSSSPARTGGPNLTPRMASLSNPAAQNGHSGINGGPHPNARPGMMQHPPQPGQHPPPLGYSGQPPHLAQQHGAAAAQQMFANPAMANNGGVSGFGGMKTGHDLTDAVGQANFQQAAALLGIAAKTESELTQEQKINLINHFKQNHLLPNTDALRPGMGQYQPPPGSVNGQYQHAQYQAQVRAQTQAQAQQNAGQMKRPGSPMNFNAASPRDSSPPDRKRARRNSGGASDQPRPTIHSGPGFASAQPNGIIRAGAGIGQMPMNGQPQSAVNPQMQHHLRSQGARMGYPVGAVPGQPPQQQQQPPQHAMKPNGVAPPPVPGASPMPDDKRAALAANNAAAAAIANNANKTMSQMKGAGMMPPPSPSMAHQPQKPNSGLPVKQERKEGSTPDAMSRSPRNATPKPGNNASTPVPNPSATPIPGPPTPSSMPPAYSTAPSPGSILMNNAHQSSSAPPAAVPSALSNSHMSAFNFGGGPYSLPLDEYTDLGAGLGSKSEDINGVFSDGELDQYLTEFLNNDMGGRDGDDSEGISTLV